MNIVMITNAYLPEMNGVSRSVAQLSEEIRRRGHRVLVIAPQDDTAPDISKSWNDLETIRVVTGAKGDGSDFSASVQLTSADYDLLDQFKPDIIHSHHPYLLGETAVRVAKRYRVPLVYTHHRMFERMVHRPEGWSGLRRFVADLCVGYCNLADAVIVPSLGVAGVLRSRGVEQPVAIVPLGVDLDRFRGGKRTEARRRWSIGENTFVVGYVGRLSQEKNIGFVVNSVAEFLRRNPGSHFLIAGDGPERAAMERFLDKRAFRGRVHFAGELPGSDLVDAYAAMDVLAYASRSDAQAIAAVEAMAAGVPVVALDAPGTRDFIHDRRNGRLVPARSRRLFVDALHEIANLSADARSRYRQAASESAKTFSLAECGEMCLAVYRQQSGTSPAERDVESSSWEAARRDMEAEWQLWLNRAPATSAMLTNGHASFGLRGLQRVVGWFRRLQRWLSRREWSVRLLNLPVSEGTEDEPGLILFQIDGLSRQQVERELDSGHMPFLRRLIERESYRIETMYSGQPTTTPAVLGEILYGVRQAVPAFGFRDHRSGEVVQMWQPSTAWQIQTELSQQGEGLLAEGSAYCIPYSGGAADSSVCPATMGWHNLEEASMWQRLAVLFLNFMSVFRLLFNSGVEFVIAVFDSIKGLSKGKQVLEEVLYIPRRVIVNIGLQEAIAIFAEVDASCGVRAIYANFVGYDENSHRRGPQSMFAHYALRGIDSALKRIWKAAQASRRRKYQVWIVSDHGQEHVVPYSELYGQTISDAVHEIYTAMANEKNDGRTLDEHGNRAAWNAVEQKAVEQKAPSSNSEGSRSEGAGKDDAGKPITVGVGPLGYVYWPDPLDDSLIDQIATRLVAGARVPLVLASIKGSVWAWNSRGRYAMPDDASRVLAPKHPHLRDVARDLAQLCSHPDAGQFIISGWRNDAMPISFVTENGAHGGPGPQETTGFVVVPHNAPFPERQSGTFRPETLRRMAQVALGHRRHTAFTSTTHDACKCARIVTYNVNGCVGLDGRRSVARIAKVLASINPDVIALQELAEPEQEDVCADRAEEIARRLEKELGVPTTWRVVVGCCGNALLSRVSGEVVRSEPFSSSSHGQSPHGALAVELNVCGEPLRIVTTQLSSIASEQSAQVEQLLGPEWLPRDAAAGPFVLCGDFNTPVGSPVHQLLCKRIREAQRAYKERYFRRKWFRRRPIARTAHCFVSDGIDVRSVDLRQTSTSRVASDHLPLVVDIEMEPVGDASTDSDEQSTNGTRSGNPNEPVPAGDSV